MAFVIADGDEGVQINVGTRLGVLGAGFRVEGFSEVVTILKSLLGADLRVASHQEADWVKAQLDLDNWEQVDASAQQHIQALADREGLLYAGFIPFADPRQLGHEIKGHMVRPPQVHIANKIKLTLGGGEQKYNLGCFVLSADWVAEADPKLVITFLQTQIDFYTKLSKQKTLPIVLEETGVLGEAVAAKNKQRLQELGLV